MKRGVWLAIGAYGTWGLFPIYWKQLQNVPSPEIVAHRAVWSLVFLMGVLLVSHRLQDIPRIFRQRRVMLVYATAGILLAFNWLIFIWGINAGHVVEASLGYFINPLMSVLLGVIFFKERLRIWQWISIGIAAGGVVYLTVSYGALPWIALALAFSFGTYGLIKKLAPLDAVEGQSIEMIVLFIPATLFLVFREVSGGGGGFVHAGMLSTAMLIFGGAVTAIPLLMFTGAARRIPLSMVGILQYITPTMQFLLGVWVYGEDFSFTRMVGFSIIWFALAVYTFEGFYRVRQNRRAEPLIVPIEL